MTALPAGYCYEPVSGLWFRGEIPPYNDELPPPGVGGRDRAGVMVVFEGDPIPSPDELRKLGYMAISIAAKPMADCAMSKPKAPAMAFDAMPTRMAREPVIEANERYQSLYNTYLLGNLPPWANREFEALLCGFANNIKELEAEIASGRNGRPDGPRKHCLKLMELAYKSGDWPGVLTDQQWADKWHVELRTYQRAKQEFPEVVAGRMASK